MTNLLNQPIPSDTPLWSWEPVMQKEIVESNEDLVPLSFLPEKVLIKPDYFIQGLSGALPELYARRSVQQRLYEATKLLPTGYKFVVFDAWRSVSTQAALFHSLNRKLAIDHPDWSLNKLRQATLETVALPSRDQHKPSPHNTGGAIDLTIVDATGLVLDMQSPFDDITSHSSAAFLEQRTDLSAIEIQARDNRRLLYNIMTTVGFTNFSNEWWHFDYGNQNWAFCSGEDYALYGATKPCFQWANILD
ncbi:M15 family metallopeptidase [Weissella diestrammenae]|uniref:D-alanyl-D-alanine dipeptidase n=1 Tax=Weissella diestrammenae TaxID=1162633 RepID=A0A7G9T684_9LACO|nr:M15 family metallopeptidase [Weissella diestrammenae]MCM0583347.1 M15 family metallopeptidase [Weissella diestrammenae]QNN75609.1 M15 family metallopeptidase [Weissella diestrammenae]